MTSSVRQNIYFRETFDADADQVVIEVEVTLRGVARISQMVILYSGNKNRVVGLAKEDMVQNLMAKLYGPVVEILEEALDEVDTSDKLAEYPGMYPRHVVKDILYRILSKVRSL